MQRQGPAPEANQLMNGYSCTMGVGDYNGTEKLILEHGGKVAVPKYALPGMAWQGCSHFRGVFALRSNQQLGTFNINPILYQSLVL
jgi:hypothetical protein